MVRLKTILSCKWLYIIILFFTIIYVYLFICVFPHNSKINPNDSYFKGVITRIKVNGDQLSLELEGIEKLVGTYYFKTLEEKQTFVNDYKLGDEVFIKGSFSNPSNNTVPNLFNYKNYLKRRGIYYLISIEQLSKLPKRQDLFYVIKNSIIDRIDMCKKSKAYLRVFILGDNSLLKTDVLNSYRENGVSHLLAISGMHISLLSGIILFLLKRIKISFFIRYVVTIIFFLFYLCLLGFSASVMRAVVLFTLLGINKLLKIGIPSIYLLFLTLCLSLFFNPYFIYDVGFQFSFTVSLSLFLIQDLLKSKKYLQSTLFVSFISFLVSFPISIYYFYQVNIFSVFYNLLFVPFVSIIVFPFALLTFIFPFLDSFLFILLQLMEEVSMYFSSIDISKIIFLKPNMIFVLFYYIVIIFYLITRKKRIFLILFLSMLVLYFCPILFPRDYMIFLDVGQGDSILISSGGKNMLIDTGGKISYAKEDWQQKDNSGIADNILIPFLKSMGISKLDFLILTHGDYDHMGDANNLVNNFKVDKVIFNNGDYNDLELELIKVLKERNVLYYQNIKELNVGNNKLYFLNNKLYDNENDNSIVLYTQINNNKLLLMGDAGVKVEQDLIKKYNLKDIDILKIGHHGSRTSSSHVFIDYVKPKYSVISVGKNNRYGHPNNEVIEVLEYSNIYRTDQTGSILFKFKNNKIEIETCSP